MMSRGLGSTGLEVSVLGFGAMQIGDPAIPEAQAGRLLNDVLDMGVRLIDTARSYGLSEERIGRHVSGRQDEFVISTKVGYGVEGHADWTADCVRQGIDDARARLCVDVIDIVHLHSCPLDTLLRNGVLEALAEARSSGKILAAAYSGDGAPLAHAAGSGLVDVVQCSYNLWDRKNLAGQASRRPAQSMGVIAKRALAGAPWQDREPAEGSPEAVYRERFVQMANRLPAMDDWASLALRFSAFGPGVTCVLCGSTSREHVMSNLAAIEKGPLEPEMLEALDAAYAAVGSRWDSIV